MENILNLFLFLFLFSPGQYIFYLLYFLWIHVLFLPQDFGFVFYMKKILEIFTLSLQQQKGEKTKNK